MKKLCKHCTKEFENRYKKVRFCSTECGYKWNKDSEYYVKGDKKKCRKCNTDKNLENFYPSKAYKDNFHPWCKFCYKISIRNSYLKRIYGISLEEYEDILNSQNRGCAICDKKEDTFLPIQGHSKNLAVDHDKKTNKIRGILCENCNRGIGLLDHNVDLLKKAIDYLNQFY